MNDTATAQLPDGIASPEAWRIEKDGDAWHAHAITEGSIDATVIPQDRHRRVFNSRAFMRNGIHLFNGDGERRERWLVLELDGVRAYISGRSVLLTKKDLYP